MRLTKQQLDALDRRLNDIVDKKVKEFEPTRKKIFEYIKTHKLKEKKVIENLDFISSYGYSLNDYYEVDGLLEYIKECRIKAGDFRKKLNEAKRESVDNMILYGLDIEEFIKSFENIQP